MTTGRLNFSHLINISFISLFLFFACRPGHPDRTSLDLWIVDFNDETRALIDTALVPSFEAHHPNVDIKVQYIPWGHFDEKLTIAFAGGVSPDVFQVGAEYIGDMAGRGQSLCLDVYVEAWGERGDFYDASWNTCVYRGHVYGIPYLSAPRALVYRADILDSAGMSKPPETWEELASTASALTLRDRAGIVRAGLYLPVSWQVFVEFLWGNGGDIVSSDEREALLDRPEAVDALQFYCDLYNKWQVCPKAGLPVVGGGVPAFAGGKAAMEINNQFALYNVKKFAPSLRSSVAIAPTPYKRRRMVTVYTDWLTISSQSKHPDLAWELVTFLVEPKNLAAYNATLFFLPPRKSCADASFIRDNPELRTFLSLMEQYGRSLPPIRRWFEIRAGLRTAVERAVYGEKTPEEALKDYNRELNELLREQEQ